MTHSFQFDPNAILGVAAGASLREIRDAYHQKSLKYHPDKGGDEWAFRMVARAYEILSTARVVDRAADPAPWPPRPQSASPEPKVHAKARADRASWTNGFGRRAASAPGPGTRAGVGGIDPGAASNLGGWSGERHSHEGMTPDRMARLVSAELLILRFELECSLDLFARSAEDRNLSCSLHVTWPIADLAERAQAIPDAAGTVKRIGEAFQARAVRKHSITRRVEAEGDRFDGWLTYPTAVMASEAFEALREALAKSGFEVEKQVREMAIPRKWK